METFINKFITTTLACALGTFIGLMSFVVTMIIIEFIC